MDPSRRRRVDPRLRPRLVPDRAASRARGGPARRRLLRLDRLGGAPGRATARARLDRAHDVPGRRALVPLEVLRRQLDDPVRLHGAPRARLPTVDEVIRFKIGEDSGCPGARGRRRAQEGRGGDRPHAALRHLAAARRAQRSRSRRSRTSSGRCRSGASSTACSGTRTRSNDDVAVAMQPPLAAVDARASVDDVFAELTGSGAAVVVARAAAARSRSSPGRICSSFSRRSGRRSRCDRRARPSRRAVTATAPTISAAPQERRRARTLVEEQRAERDGDERVDVLVRHDLRDRRVVEQPGVGAEADHRAEDREVRPCRDRPRLRRTRCSSSRGLTHDETGRGEHDPAAEHLVDGGDEAGRPGRRRRRETNDPLDQDSEAVSITSRPDRGRRRPPSPSGPTTSASPPRPTSAASDRLPRHALSRRSSARRRSGAGRSRRSSRRRSSRSASRPRARGRRRMRATRPRALPP